MSALVRSVAQPRAIIVALHGGAATSRYFHHPGRSDLSLLDVGAALGFTVVALDRPGYGDSAAHAPSLMSPDRRVDLAYAAVRKLVGTQAHDADMFVLAHSAGCELAVRMAADKRGRYLLGLELAATGRRFHPTAEEILANGESTPGKPIGLRRVLWQPAELYPDNVIGGKHFVSSAPAYEADAVTWWAPRDFAQLAGEVRIPVHYTLGEHELVWRNDGAEMAEIAALFGSSPRVVTELLAHGVHNLSVGLAARAYHLKILSFVEECVIAREQSGIR